MIENLSIEGQNLRYSDVWWREATELLRKPNNQHIRHPVPFRSSKGMRNFRLNTDLRHGVIKKSPLSQCLVHGANEESLLSQCLQHDVNEESVFSQCGQHDLNKESLLTRKIARDIRKDSLLCQPIQHDDNKESLCSLCVQQNVYRESLFSQMVQHDVNKESLLSQKEKQQAYNAVATNQLQQKYNASVIKRLQKQRNKDNTTTIKRPKLTYIAATKQPNPTLTATIPKPKSESIESTCTLRKDVTTASDIVRTTLLTSRSSLEWKEMRKAYNYYKMCVGRQDKVEKPGESRIISYDRIVLCIHMYCYERRKLIKLITSELSWYQHAG